MTEPHWIDSATEYHLRTLVDRLTTALVQHSRVRVVPSQDWRSDPFTDPPTLWYRVADVAVLGDQIKAVTCREIGRLLFSQAADWTYDVSHNPQAAEMVLNVVETARIEMKMAGRYYGTRFIFDRFNGEEKPDGAWSNPQVKKDFPLLPVRWRFVLQIQRLLNGLEPVGTGFEVDMVRDVEHHFRTAVMEETTQGVVNNLRPVYERLLDAIAREEEMQEEKRQYQEYCKACEDEQVDPLPRQDWRDAGMPEEPPEEDPGASDSVSDFEHPPAEEDDGQPGGEDHSAGKRQHGRGLSGPDTESGDAGDSTSPDSGEGDGASTGAPSEPSTEEGGSPDAEPSDTEGGDDGEEGAASGEPPPSPSPAKVKTGSIFREMVEDLPEGVGGKAVQNFKAWFNRIDREARKVERQIDQEHEDSMVRMAQGLGNESGRRTDRVRRIVDKNEDLMAEVLPMLDPMIRAVRLHAKGVLADNARDRWGGSYRTGRKLKRRSLHRIVTQEEPTVFERKRMLGGRSYCIAPCIDQSSSMFGDPQMLAAMATIVALEGLDGITDTACTGFFTRPPGPQWPETTVVHEYKRPDEPISHVRPLLGEMFESDGSTPMGAGLGALVELVKGSTAEVKVIILVSDGVPTDGAEWKVAFKEAHKARIPVDALAIGGAKPFHHHNCRRVIEVTDSEQIVPGFMHLLRGVVRREGAYLA